MCVLYGVHNYFLDLANYITIGSVNMTEIYFKPVRALCSV